MDEELTETLRQGILQNVNAWQKETEAIIQRLGEDGALKGKRMEEAAIREAQRSHRHTLVELVQRLTNARNMSPQRRQLAEELIRFAQGQGIITGRVSVGAEVTPEILRNDIQQFADEIRQFVEKRFSTN